jgi:hypothetical protein
MMQLLLARAFEIEGIEQIVLAVATSATTAIALYQSLGFRSFGTERRALKIGERYVGFEHMVLEVGADAVSARGNHIVCAMRVAAGPCGGRADAGAVGHDARRRRGGTQPRRCGSSYRQPHFSPLIGN